MSPLCRCGIPLVASVVTGKPVKKDDKLWKCKHCRHCALMNEMKDIKFCPLCHFQI
ncbi:hypothetical protein TVAG_379470 [Trichomonas vaginalis G3]|uniref:IFT121-like zinc finger domain-containing protein n=1 Tax=Trichomonas vaginalis (strain ATCC PRA-98 / G3) TaxID=412133 RepID=A2E7H2_TRIV3|nr:cellular response to paclitaxel [Trichomonas vaginalis G3]EAY11365.1 hypothetical protein TVAG_379470 [Trichomonas vaginalis G3]KAI5530530.1 cellular response to paclitaxel [Trichomonas vaginalis G3]|eukprot:XP_001323588.1 hypothetical protein [Trichomonas vaginalis G3]